MLWQLEELDKISDTRQEEIEFALDKLFSEHPDLKRAVVINAYLDKKISLSKAAEELELSRIELEKQLDTEGIPVYRISDEDLKAEVRAVKTWK